MLLSIVSCCCMFFCGLSIFVILPVDFFFLTIRRPPISTLFPCTTLFRSRVRRVQRVVADVDAHTGDLAAAVGAERGEDRKSTRLNSSHANISYAVFCL